MVVIYIQDNRCVRGKCEEMVFKFTRLSDHDIGLTGAAMAVFILRSAANLYNEMATFASAGVSSGD